MADSPVPKGCAFRRTLAPLHNISDEDIMKFTDELIDMDQHNCARYLKIQTDPKKKWVGLAVFSCNVYFIMYNKIIYNFKDLKKKLPRD